MRLLARAVATTAVLSVLAACQTTPQAPTAWQAGSRDDLNFSAAGRLAVKQNDKGSYANFDWDSNGKMQQLSVNTPLGNTVGELCQDGNGVVATASNGEVYQAATASELSERLMGFAIPVESLDLWAHGYYADNQPHTVDEQGRLLQAGWKIERQVDAQGQPRILVLDNQQLSIRLAFNDYQAGASALESSTCQR
ncbi:outer membrane lipoprotein LolB [Vitreoscilla massiliensis]|uniref:Outer-membrane lipoprotein LolB n=1 Tax=Vitreoscilla massiliensis TaxID=1689272 RepID=A0ABY4DXP4_9NEIS|nr:outer membrane lipoprotein LolB [Vitreoscilla massiliensis]UOO88034.1 outer membrane lipoprotein LolB [Vitreoscilla massiliensis]